MEKERASEKILKCYESSETEEEQNKCAILKLAEMIDDQKETIMQPMTDLSISVNNLRSATGDLSLLTAGIYNAVKSLDQRTDRLIEWRSTTDRHSEQSNLKLEEIDLKLSDLQQRLNQTITQDDLAQLKKDLLEVLKPQ